LKSIREGGINEADEQEEVQEQSPSADETDWEPEPGRGLWSLLTAGAVHEVYG